MDLLKIKNSHISISMLVFFMSLFLLFSLQASASFLLMPTTKDLTRLSSLFHETRRPVPVHFAFNSDVPGSAVFGIALSTTIRSGVHAKLLVAAGITSNLYTSKYESHGYKVGTLFLERQNGKPVLSIHGRNSYRSTINEVASNTTSGGYKIPVHVLTQIYFQTGLEIVNASSELDNVIRDETEKRYIPEGTDIDIKNELREYHELNYNYNFNPPAYDEMLKPATFVDIGNDFHIEFIEKIINKYKVQPMACRSLLL